MDTGVTIANVLISLSAHAKSRGLHELEKLITNAATAALLEVPDALDVPELKQLAGVTSSRLVVEQTRVSLQRALDIRSPGV